MIETALKDNLNSTEEKYKPFRFDCIKSTDIDITTGCPLEN